MSNYLYSGTQNFNLLSMNNFTPEDLICYLYNESSPAKAAAIETALETNWSLREKFEVIAFVHKRLKTIKMSPHPKTISRILNHAEKTIPHYTSLT